MLHPLTQTLMSRLKNEAGPLHTRLEKLPFFAALSQERLPLASYVNQLRAFATAFGTLEHESATVLEPSVRVVLGIGESRFTHLLRDLALVHPPVAGSACQAPLLIGEAMIPVIHVPCP